MISNRDDDKIGNLTARQYFFDLPPDNRVTYFQIASQTTQAKLFAAIFAAFAHLTETNLKFIFPIGTILSIVPETIKLYRYIGRKNKSAKSWSQSILDAGGTLLEIAAVTIFVAALITSLAWIAPLLFLINAGAKFLWSVGSMTYYFAQMCRNWHHDETYTQKHRSDTANFIQATKEMLLSGAFLGFVLIVFFIPTAFPAVALGAALAYGIEIAASVIFGAFGLWGTGKFIKQMAAPAIPEGPANAAANDPTLKKHYSDKNKFNTLASHVDDLLIKLKLFTTLSEKKDFLLALLTEEKGHLQGKFDQRFRDKEEARGKLAGILMGTEEEYKSVRGLLTHYETTEQIKNIFTSYFRPTGRMQKLFFLMYEYEKEKARLEPQGPMADTQSEVIEPTPEPNENLHENLNENNFTHSVPPSPPPEKETNSTAPSEEESGAMTIASNKTHVAPRQEDHADRDDSPVTVDDRSPPYWDKSISTTKIYNKNDTSTLFHPIKPQFMPPEAPSSLIATPAA